MQRSLIRSEFEAARSSFSLMQKLCSSNIRFLPERAIWCPVARQKSSFTPLVLPGVVMWYSISIPDWAIIPGGSSHLPEFSSIDIFLQHINTCNRTENILILEISLLANLIDIFPEQIFSLWPVQLTRYDNATGPHCVCCR